MTGPVPTHEYDRCDRSPRRHAVGWLAALAAGLAFFAAVAQAVL